MTFTQCAFQTRKIDPGQAIHSNIYIAIARCSDDPNLCLGGVMSNAGSYGTCQGRTSRDSNGSKDRKWRDPGPRSLISLWILFWIFWILFSALDSKISKFHVIRTPHLRGPCITRAALQLVDPSLVSVLNSQMNMWPLISQGVDCLHCLDIVYIVYIIMTSDRSPMPNCRMPQRLHLPGWNGRVQRIATNCPGQLHRISDWKMLRHHKASPWNPWWKIWKGFGTWRFTLATPLGLVPFQALDKPRLQKHRRALRVSQNGFCTDLYHLSMSIHFPIVIPLLKGVPIFPCRI
jgi:hypothetical protein